jgi:hypothetical protein
VALAHSAVGQNVTLLPNIGVAQAEYNDALESWLHDDRTLEKDLLTGDPAQMRRRVKRAADLRDQVMIKKQAYLDLMIQSVRAARARLAPPDASEIPVKDFNKDMEAQEQSILSDRMRITEALRQLPAGDDSVLLRRALEAELASLDEVRTNIAARISSLDDLDHAQEAIRSVLQGETEAQTLDGVLKIWEQERAAAGRQRTSWAGLYMSMELAIDERIAGRKGNAPEAKQIAPEPSPRGLAGTWVYRSEAGGWKGEGEPQTVTLEIHQDGDTLSGAYNAALPANGGLHVVQLVLSGPASASNTVRLRWTSLADSDVAGEMELKLVAGGKLSVERLTSGDSFIPLGMEMLSRP